MLPHSPCRDGCAVPGPPEVATPCRDGCAVPAPPEVAAPCRGRCAVRGSLRSALAQQGAQLVRRLGALVGAQRDASARKFLLQHAMRAGGVGTWNLARDLDIALAG